MSTPEPSSVNEAERSNNGFGDDLVDHWCDEVTLEGPGAEGVELFGVVGANVQALAGVAYKSRSDGGGFMDGALDD